jgi:peptide/nickel transport system substrate-binding protein
MKKLGMRTDDVSRRRFLQLGAMGTAGLVAAACGGEPAAEDMPAAAAETESQAPSAAASSSSRYNEAPMLADMVAGGDLEPVDERVSANPLVLEGMEGIGNYGGVMRRGFKGVSDRWGPTKLARQGLTWYTPELSLRPNIAESWEVNADATSWTFHLREGMKWSDGAPFDTDNFQWWYENIMLNTDLTPSVGRNWVTGAERTPMVMEFPGKHTVVFNFGHPNPMFLDRVAPLTRELFTPHHYVAQFHMETTEDKDGLEAAVAESGFDTWTALFTDRDWWYLNPERPDVFSYTAKNPLSEELFIMERNPYFWQVDPDGNQLPYIDTIRHRLFDTNDVFDLRIINGEVDFQQRHVSAANFTLYKENEESGGFRVQLGAGDQHVCLTPNMTVQKPRLREFFQNLNVRIAMSLAVDRDTLNELAFEGLYTPRQYSPLEQSPQSYPKQANAYLDYDPDRAGQLLDEAGYAEKDDDGFRVYPDGSGETVSFVVEGTAQQGSPDEDAVQIIIGYLADVGIKAAYKGIERSLYEEHWGANDIDAAFWGSGRSLLPLVDPAFFLGTGLDRPWGEAWGRWRLDPSHPAAEEPPADHWIRTMWGLWDEILVEPDEARRNELFLQILDVWAEQLPQIGYLGQIPNPLIVLNGLRGLDPDYVYPLSNPTSHGGLVQVHTFYWDDPASQS